MRRIVIAVLVVATIHIAFAAAPANAGGTKELAIGTLLGMGVGITFGGAFLLFGDTNVQADENIDTFLWTGAGIGAAGGFVLGAFIPEGAELNPVQDVSTLGGDARLMWPSLYLIPSERGGKQEIAVGAKVIHLVF